MFKKYIVLTCMALSLSLQAAVTHINNVQDFNQLVLNSSIPVVVKFSGKKCPPCIRFAPVFEQVSREFENRVRFVAIDVDAVKSLSNAYDIRSIPSILYFTNGNRKSTETGYKSADSFRSSIRRIFGF
jgi:thioredoxin 1